VKKVLLFAIPLSFFVFISLFLYQGLFSDPRARDSALLDQPLPPFNLPDLMRDNLVHTPEVFKGEVTLLNVWGTWCTTCAIELPYFTQLREQGVRIVGLYYEQDIDPDFGGKSLAQIRRDVEQMLGRLGDPYAFNIFDHNRDYSLDLGITGAPETFVIDKQGIVRLHHIGDVNERIWRAKIAPVFQSLL